MRKQTKIVNKKNNAGFTLIELLVAMALSACVMTAIYSLYISSDKIYTAQNQVAYAQQDARAGLDILGREIRMAGFIAPADRNEINTDVAGQTWSDGTNENLEEADVDRISFQVDTDNDGVTETVRYVYNAATREITRQEWSWTTAGWIEWQDAAGAPLGAQTVIPNVTACQFNYFDASGNDLGAALSSDARETVRAVTITITVRTGRPDPSYINPDGVNGNYRTKTLTSRFFMRNMGL